MKRVLSKNEKDNYELVHENNWFSVRKTIVFDSVIQQKKEFFSIHHDRPAVSIIAHNGQEILLIKQYRYLVDKIVWALPSGGVDENECPIDAAKRELLEETGYIAEQLDEIIKYNPTYGCSDQVFITFICDNPKFIGMSNDQDEVMDVQWFSYEKIINMIDDGEIVDGFSITPIFKFFLSKD